VNGNRYWATRNARYRRRSEGRTQATGRSLRLTNQAWPFVYGTFVAFRLIVCPAWPSIFCLNITMPANARLTPNQVCMEKEKRRIRITEFLKGQADKGNIPKVASTYDDSTGKFVSSDSPPPYAHHLWTHQADEPKINKDFQEALQRCENLQILSRLKIDVHNCSWNDVFAQMTKANLDYQKQGEGLKNLMTRLWRAMGRGAENAKPWIELIPGDMGLDTLKAGLALCFSVRIDARSHMPSRLMRD